jgi:hypothetical protein
MIATTNQQFWVSPRWQVAKMIFGVNNPRRVEVSGERAASSYEARSDRFGGNL